MKEQGVIKPNKTARYFKKIYQVAYFFGFPNVWVEEPLQWLPKPLYKLHYYCTKLITICTYLFLVFQCLSYYTQTDLDEELVADRVMITIASLCLFIFYISTLIYKELIRKALYDLAVNLKVLYNNPIVEKKMLKKSFLYTTAYMSCFVLAMTSYNWHCYMLAQKTGTFNTAILIWPKVEDTSRTAGVARIMICIITMLFQIRMIQVYWIVIPITTALSHQFMNIRMYFIDLKGIFDRQLKQEEKEVIYEKDFKAGIKLHSDTLKCAEEVQQTCALVYSTQIVVNIAVLVIVMYQFVKCERKVADIMSVASIGAATLFSSGFIMWNAGDVTIEAEMLPTAMYCSGWENCTRESAVRVRKLVVISMMMGQKPVELRGLGLIKLSYESYVSLVKSSYSLFSIIAFD